MDQMFTEDNTDGFTEAELAILNDVAGAMLARNPDADVFVRGGIADAITQAWASGVSAEDLLEEATRRLEGDV